MARSTAALTLTGIAAVTVAFLLFGGPLLETVGFMPREHCVASEWSTLSIRIVGDSITALAYFSIPVAIEYYRRTHDDVLPSWALYSFETFILLCGTTHTFDVVLIWWPVYRLDAAIRLLTAIVSILTAAALAVAVPQAIARLRQIAVERATLMKQYSVSENRLRELTADPGASWGQL